MKSEVESLIKLYEQKLLENTPVGGGRSRAREDGYRCCLSEVITDLKRMLDAYPKTTSVIPRRRPERC